MSVKSNTSRLFGLASQVLGLGLASQVLGLGLEGRVLSLGLKREWVVSLTLDNVSLTPALDCPH